MSMKARIAEKKAKLEAMRAQAAANVASAASAAGSAAAGAAKGAAGGVAGVAKGAAGGVAGAAKGAAGGVAGAAKGAAGGVAGAAGAAAGAASGAAGSVGGSIRGKSSRASFLAQGDAGMGGRDEAVMAGSTPPTTPTAAAGAAAAAEEPAAPPPDVAGVAMAASGVVAEEVASAVLSDARKDFLKQVMASEDAPPGAADDTDAAVETAAAAAAAAAAATEADELAAILADDDDFSDEEDGAPPDAAQLKAILASPSGAATPERIPAGSPMAATPQAAPPRPAPEEENEPASSGADGAGGAGADGAGGGGGPAALAVEGAPAGFGAGAPRRKSVLQRDIAPNSSVVRLEKLPKTSAQMSNPQMQTDAGRPTCLTVRSRFLVIGTDLGLVMVFDHFQVLKNLLGSLKVKRGAVSSLDVSMPSGEWLVVGHSDGTIVLYDILQGTQLKEIKGVHTLAVVFTHFLPGAPTVVTVDVRGTANKVTFQWRMVRYNFKHDELFDGSLGAISAIAVLPPSPARTSTNDLHLTAMCTSTMIFVMTLEPQATVCFKVRRPGSVGETSLPYLSWRPDVRKGKNKLKQNTDPILVVAWGRHILMLQLMLSWLEVGEESKVKFVSKGNFENVQEVSAVTWLNPSVFVFTDGQQHINIFDPSTLSILERIDISGCDVVSHGMLGAKTQSFHHSISNCDENIYMLGQVSLNKVRVFTWMERIEVLVDAAEWEEALTLALDFYEGKAKAADGLPTDFETLHRVIGDHISELIMSYLKDMIRTANELTGQQREDSYRKSIQTCIEYCVSISREDTLFDTLYPKFCEENEQSLFLTMVEPQILQDHLRVLAPSVLEDFVKHFHANHAMSRAEECLLHLDPERVDFDQIVGICRVHQLFTALAYFFTKGKADWITPANEMLRELRTELEFGDEDMVKNLGSQFFRYLRACFTEDSGPEAVLPLKYAATKANLCSFLALPVETEVLYDGHEVSDDSFPRLRALLTFDAEQTLDVFTSLFDGTCSKLENRTNAVGGKLKEGEERGSQAVFDGLADIAINRQREFDGGSSDFEDWSQPASAWKPRGMGSADLSARFYSHVARWLTAGRIACQAFNNPEDITPNPMQVNRVMAYLVAGPAPSSGGNVSNLQHKALTVSDREDCLLKLLREFEVGTFDEEGFLAWVEQRMKTEGKGDGVTSVNLQRVTAYLYELRGDYAKVLEAMLGASGSADETQQKSRAADIYAFLGDILTQQELSAAKKDGVRKAFQANFEMLVLADAKNAATFVIEHFREHSAEMAGALAQDEQMQFKYMNAKIEIGQNASDAGDIDRAALVSLSTGETEIYMGLLCRFDPGSVYPYLSSSDSYRLDHCLELCQQYNITDATAFLLEKMGDAEGALELILGEFEPNLRDSYVAAALAGKSTEANDARDAFEGGCLNVAVKLCEGYSEESTDEQEKQALWFRLLDEFTAISTRVQDGVSDSYRHKQAVVDSVIEFKRVILRAMMTHVQLRAVLNKVIQEHGNTSLLEMGSLLSDMLDAYSYEIEIFEKTKKLMADDNSNGAMDLFAKASSGMVVNPTIWSPGGLMFTQASLASRGVFVVDEPNSTADMFPFLEFKEKEKAGELDGVIVGASPRERATSSAMSRSRTSSAMSSTSSSSSVGVRSARAQSLQMELQDVYPHLAVKEMCRSLVIESDSSAEGQDSVGPLVRPEVSIQLLRELGEGKADLPLNFPLNTRLPPRDFGQDEQESGEGHTFFKPPLDLTEFSYNVSNDDAVQISADFQSLLEEAGECDEADGEDVNNRFDSGEFGEITMDQ